MNLLYNQNKTLPDHLTSYDLLKALALILMFVDHIGYFFFPEEVWFRVVGRMSVPIWFFLIGFANTRDVPKLFWIAGAAVLLSSMVAGEYVFPVNIIFTLIFARLSVDWIYSHAMRTKETLWGMFLLLSFLAFPSLILFEYGTLGFLFALMGCICRNRADITAPRWVMMAFLCGISCLYIVVQSVLMPSLSTAQFFVFVGSMAALIALLFNFKTMVFDGFPRMRILQFMGRRTLEIYAVHLIIFRAVAMMSDPERFSFFDFKITAFPQILAFVLA